MALYKLNNNSNLTGMLSKDLQEISSAFIFTKQDTNFDRSVNDLVSNHSSIGTVHQDRLTSNYSRFNPKLFREFTKKV